VSVPVFEAFNVLRQKERCDATVTLVFCYCVANVLLMCERCDATLTQVRVSKTGEHEGCNDYHVAK
jgi:hypothetical protein